MNTTTTNAKTDNRYIVNGIPFTSPDGTKTRAYGVVRVSTGKTVQCFSSFDLALSYINGVNGVYGA